MPQYIHDEQNNQISNKKASASLNHIRAWDKRKKCVPLTLAEENSIWEFSKYASLLISFLIEIIPLSDNCSGLRDNPK